MSADGNKQLARAYIDAGCIRVQDGQYLALFLGSLRHWLLRTAGRMPKARIKGKLPIEIVVKADELKVPTSVQLGFARQDAKEQEESDDGWRWSDDSYSPRRHWILAMIWPQES